MPAIGLTAAAAPVTASAPTLGSGSTFTNTTNATAFTFSGHSSSTGDVLVRIFGRVNASTFTALTVLWGGAAVTQRRFVRGSAQGRAYAWIGTLKGGLTGARDLYLEGTGNGAHGNVVVRINDLNDWSGMVGNYASSDHPGVKLLDASADRVTASLIAEASASRIVGVAGAVHGGAGPFDIPGWLAGWAKGSTGSNADTDCAAAFPQKVGGDAGSIETLTAIGDLTTDDWAAALLELR